MIFTHTPDDQILIVDGDKRYVDSLDAFLVDAGKLKLSYAECRGFRALNYKDGVLTKWDADSQTLTHGWEEGDKILAHFADLLGAQQMRLNPPKPILTLPEVKVAQIAFVYKLCSQARTAVAGTADKIKIASWANYRQIAESYAQGTLSDSDENALLTEIKIRNKNETLEQFVNKILANAVRYTQACAVITGAEKLAVDSITVASSLADIDKSLAVLGEHLGSLNAQV